MNVLAFWELEGLTMNGANPYMGLLAQAMSSFDVQYTAAFPENMTVEWMKENAQKYSILHLHWPSFLYQAGSLGATVQRCAAMMDALLVARSMGCKIVWTMHNLYPHDSKTHELDHVARLMIVSTASAVIVHCEKARRLLESHFHRSEGVFTIPHGHFCDPYPNTVSVAEARARFEFTEHEYVYLFIGTVRANKGVEYLIESFHHLPNPNARLLLAARVCNDYGASLVESVQQHDSRIATYVTDLFANDEFQNFYNATDVAVFPFSDILTSGSAITALSFYCPVIVPNLGCLPELVTPSVGMLYNSNEPGALRSALQAAPGKVQRNAMRPAIHQLLESLNWTEIARKTFDAYRH